MNTYGVLINGAHVDTSKTERGAKNYATRNGYNIVTMRYNCGYIAVQIAHNYLGEWKKIAQVHTALIN
jgi:hypothetical protein